MNYFENPALNWSTLKHLFKSPAHALEAKKSQKQSVATELGTLLHTAILEPRKLEAAHVYEKQDGRTKEGKAQAEKLSDLRAEGVLVIQQDQFALVSGMAKAVFANPKVKNLADSVTSSEQEIYWTDSVTGLELKAKIDFIADTKAIIGDIKTTSEDARRFQNQAARFHYFGQAAFYMRACEAVNIPVDEFIWIVIESEPPHGVCLYYLDPMTRHACNKTIDNFLMIWRQCVDSESFPAYESKLESLSAPDWYVKLLEENI